MKKYELKAIGYAVNAEERLLIQMEPAVIPAMKYLSLFSHALLVFGDGTGSLCVRPVRLLEADEKAGRIIPEDGCGLLAGNVLYDIKPYMPCEDRIRAARMPEGVKADQSGAVGGPAQLLVPEAGMIRKEKGQYFLYPDDFDTFLPLLEGCSHIRVLWWFSRFDKPEYRRAMQGDPPYENAPRSGVFATRSPVRPNPIALTVAEVLVVDRAGRRIEVSGLDCFDRTPLLGIRPYLPATDQINDFAVPPWLEHWPEYKEIEEAVSDAAVTLAENGENRLEEYLQKDAARMAEDFFNGDERTAGEDQNRITIHGARQNNLKDLSLILPKGKVIAIAGVSGSGKSSLAFDTIYAESRLRLSETADSMEKPEVDSIAGLPPAVAIAQRAIGRNPRSTVGTLTGIQDRLRLMYAAIGRRHCPECGKPAIPRSRDELVKVLTKLADHSLTITPYRDPAALIRTKAGQTADWEKFVDEALRIGRGAFYLQIDDQEEILLQNRQMCYHCGHILFEMSPAVFSYNNPESMCPVCSGLGRTNEIDADLIVEAPELSLLDGASAYWGDMRSFIRNPTANWMRGELLALAAVRGVDLETPWNRLPEAFRRIALYGSSDEEVSWSYTHPQNGRSGTITRPVEGAVPVLNRLLKKGGSTAERIADLYVRSMACPACQGERLNREGRMVTVAGRRFPQVAAMTVQELFEWIGKLPGQLDVNEAGISRRLLQDIYRKAVQLMDMGLMYLNLDRAVPTLSGGELQRLKLAAQMGIGLSGLLYVMDEPTAGLHPRDYPGIVAALQGLRDEGNTVLVVEHEEEILRRADWLVEIGPGAGDYGGDLIWQGEPVKIAAAKTQTARFLSGQERIAVNRPGLPGEAAWVEIRGASGNNLQDIDVTFPRGRITCVTGVSGSGKSTLTGKVIVPAVESVIAGERLSSGCRSISGAEGIKAVVYASQAAIGRSSRSNIMTYMGLLDEIRKIFAATPEARAAGLSAPVFSFNSKEGQCDACKGEGVQMVAVPFAADIRTVCPVCAGKRYKQKVLTVLYREKSVFEVMELSIAEALIFFSDQEKCTAILRILCEVGLGYLKLGQGTPTLSGGEAQRLKLAKVLTGKHSGPTLYILDEPTSGLHFSDIQSLLLLLSGLAAEGHTVLVIEHNLHVIRNADWIIDLGPEGGTAGGRVLVQGEPKTVAGCRDSYTGAALAAQ